MAHQISSDVEHAEVPTAGKWSVRKTRGGHAGDIVWVFGVLDMSGRVLKEFTLTKPLGEALDNLQPEAIVRKIFGCGTQKDLKKH